MKTSAFFVVVFLAAQANAQESELTSGEFSPIGTKSYFSNPTYCGVPPVADMAEINQSGVQHQSSECSFHAFSPASNTISSAVRGALEAEEVFSEGASVYRVIASCRGELQEDWAARSLDVALVDGGSGRRMYLPVLTRDSDPEVEGTQYQMAVFYECIDAEEPASEPASEPQNASAEPQAPRNNYVVNRDANFRAGPNRNSASLGVFSSGTRVRVIRNVRGWLEVSHNGRRVFVWDELADRL